MNVTRLRTQSGFTMIDLIMVIIILSFMSLAFIMLLPVPSIQLTTSATQLSDDIRYTQSLSMTRGKHYRLTELSTTTYQIQDNTGTAILLGTGSTTATLNTGVTFGTWTNLTNNLIAFNGRGIPFVDAAATATQLASTATINLAASSGSITVVISPTTGRALVQ